MIAFPYDYFLVAWFAFALASTAYVAVDQFGNNPEPTVMKWGFILVTLYMGPFGLLLYVLADKEPRPGQHEEFTSPLWKQGVGSTIHCVAGDATGIIMAAVITASLGLPMWIDLIVEYIAGFSFGLFIFQSLFMKRMMGGTYWQNVKMSFMPEFISMNAMMAGMAPTMSYLMMGRDMRAMDPLELIFWGVMSLGVMVGFTTAYPFNVWMVKKGIKHGLMTERPEKEGGQQKDGGDGHGSHGGGHKMKSEATTPQLAALAGVTSFLLLTGMIVPGFSVNLRLSARDVDASIMPPGMINTFDLPAAAMKDMAAVKPRQAGFEAASDARGDQPLEPRIENGVKVFHIDASIIRWHILPDVAVDAYAYNRQIPGPRLQVTEGDHIRINFTNHLPESTTVHWHGLIVPNEMDGPAKVAQPPIPPGGTYTYDYTVGQHGTYFYHSHDHPDRQQALGLYGALIIAPKNAADEVKADLDYTIQLQEWLKREWLTYPAMLMEGELPNYFTINGKAYPATDTINMKVGETIKVRFIGTNNNFVHPMHIHGGPFEVVAVDGVTLQESARYQADTVNVGPGQRYDVLWTARKPGKWLVHCHIPHHTANNNVEQNGGGGLMLVLNVRLTESLAAPLLAETRQRFQEQLASKDAEVARKSDELRQQREQLQKERETLDDQVKQRLAAERSELVAIEAKKAREAASAELATKASENAELRQMLDANNAKLAEAQQAHAEVMRKQRALDDEKRELDLTVEKRVQASIEQIHVKARQEADEAARLRVAEKDQTIESMTRTIEELKRKAEQGSQQSQGEVLELELEELLRGRFPTDTIEPVGKGELGADVVQQVNGQIGQPAGMILWETKRTKAWSDGWLAKLRDDQRRSGADIALIISHALPKHIEQFDLVDGVWVAHPRCALPVAVALRQGLIDVSSSRLVQQGQQTKMEQVYNYLTGTKFRQRVEAVVEKFNDMRDDLDKERKFMGRQWAKRETQILAVIDTTVGMVGDLQAIAGKAMPEIPSLDLPLLEDSIVTEREAG